MCVPSELTFGVPAVKFVPVAPDTGSVPVVSIVPSALTVKLSVPTPGRVKVTAPETLATPGAHFALYSGAVDAGAHRGSDVEVVVIPVSAIVGPAASITIPAATAQRLQQRVEI